MVLVPTTLGIMALAGMISGDMRRRGKPLKPRKRAALPIFRVSGIYVFGLTEAQIAEWRRDLGATSLRKRIYLEECVVPKKLYERGPEAHQSMSDDTISSLVRAANVRVAADPASSKVDHSRLRELTSYMDKRTKVGAEKAGPPPKPYGQ